LIGPGLPIYTDKGATIRREIINYSNELQSAIGYQEVHTPNINKADLFKVSGHYEKFEGDMLKVVSHYTDEEYFLKPMNCPQHTQIFSSTTRSYKDLPLRISDFANLYRDEKPGELSGLMRLRCFCQDDGHCFCREDQIKAEFSSVLGAIKKAMQTYGMKYKIRLSLWDPKTPEKYLGKPAVWKKSQKLLEEILIENKIEYSIGIGEAAMYGPKMDLMAKDSLGREWQISTIQLDFIMPDRFELNYIDEKGKKHTPVMIHRAITGSPERFLGILIEHYAGHFPLWLSPVQVEVIPISEKFEKYGKEIL
jgi:threonyl-tRNA synthetase